jgi:hypothetical protein
MALVVKDRVLETSNTNGTDTFTLAGAVNGFQSFSVIGVGNTTYYAITEETNNQWEVGIGTVGSGTLTRDTVLSSSNSGNKVDFADGLKQVFCDYPASKAVTLDTNGNLTTNNLFEGFSNTAASGTQIVLTAASVPSYVITGSGGQTIKLPDATTLPNGTTFAFNNNQSSGAISVNNNSNTLVVSIPSGAFTIVTLLSNSIAAGSWDTHDQSPANVSWSTNTFSYAGSFTNGTWNGNTVAVNRGGTGATTLTGYVKGSGTSALTASSTIPSTDISGLGTMSTQNANAVAISGGTIDNTVIGGTTPAAGTFNTLIGGKSSTTYVTITGDASYPMIQATGGTNTPLVLSPLGTGALQAQKTDSTATGGNARGANAVDWQTNRSSAGQVASGSASVLSGGQGNQNTSSWGVIGGGYFNTNNSYIGTLLGGQSNTVGSQLSVSTGGQSNTANGFYNFIGGGYTNSGTSNSAVTTQSGTMNATTAVTLSGSNANIKVGQLIQGTSIASYTYVAAISGTSLTLSQAASGSSTSTLSFFTPHGVVVGGGNNQATGSYSFIGGGGDAGTAANRNVASGDWSFVGGGRNNTASGLSAFVGGGGVYSPTASSTFPNTASGVSSVVVGGLTNTASAQSAIVGAGYSNNATGLYSSILGGTQNTASGIGSFIGGGYYATTRTIQGNHVFSACVNPISASQGVSQAALLVLGKQTTDATATVLTSDGAAGGSTNQVILPNNSAYYFKGAVIAGVTGAGDTKGWSIEGVIKRGAGVGTTALVGTPTVTSLYADAGAATWAVTATADTTNGGLKITVTGQASTTIRWVCELDTTEMTY